MTLSKHNNYWTITLLALLIGGYFSSTISHAQNQAQNPYEQLVDEYPFHEETPGMIVLLTKGEKTLLHKAVGQNRQVNGIALDTSRIVPIASITKPMTATAILLLAQEKKLSVKDPISKYIKDLPAAAQKIKIEHLLSHTSGLVNTWDLPHFHEMNHPIELEALLRKVCAIQLSSAPGTKYYYSNGGYVILGYLIEQISGMSYAAFMRKRIFDPLQMNNIFYGDSSIRAQYPIDGHLINAAQGKAYQASKVPHADWIHAAGALYADSRSVQKWSNAIHHEQFLRKKCLKKALTTYQLENGAYGERGFGWEIGQIEGHTAYAHTGQLPGQQAITYAIPEADLFLFIYANVDGISLQELSFSLLKEALKKD